MKVLLQNISPLRAGTVLAALYAIMSLLIIPVFLFIGLIAGRNGSGAKLPFLFAGIGALFLPFIYAFLGFVVGAVGALIYNLLAKLTGGLEFTFAVQDAPAAAPVAPAVPPARA